MPSGLLTAARIVAAVLVFEVVLIGTSVATYVVGLRAVATDLQASFGLLGLGVAEAIAVVALLLVWRWLDGRPVVSLGLRLAHALPCWGRGAAVGALMMSFVVLVWYTLLDGAAWQTNPHPLRAAGVVVAGFIGYVIQGPSEELLFRGHMFENIRREWGLAWAIGVSSVAFGLFHSLNPDFGLLPLVNLVLFGVATALYKVYVDGGQLWGVFALHSIWNWLQQVVFGLPNSGVATTADNALFTISPDTSLPEVVWGGGFGPEGTLAASLVLLVLIAVCLRRAQRTLVQTRSRPARSPLI